MQHGLMRQGYNSREYYARNNELVQIYLYIDRLLDSSLPQDLLKTYHDQVCLHTRTMAKLHLLIFGSITMRMSIRIPQILVPHRQIP